MFFPGAHGTDVKHNLTVRIPAVSKMQIFSSIISSVKLIDIFHATPRTQLQRSGLQHFKEILFAISMLEGASYESHHYDSCIAYASYQWPGYLKFCQD